MNKLAKESRNSSLELLRIIAMFLIVLHHFVMYGVGLSNPITSLTDNNSINMIAAQFMVIGGKIGVSIFVLITGYFSIKTKYKMSKLFHLYIQLWSYSVIIFLLFVVFMHVKIDLINFCTSFLPVVFQQWWFLTVFIFLMIISPFINILVENLSKEQFFHLLIFLMVTMSIVPTFSNIIVGKTYKQGSIDLSQTLFFILVYLIGGFIRLYKDDFQLRKIGLFLIFVNLFFSYSSILFFDFINLHTKNNTYAIYATMPSSEHSVFLLGISVGLFLVFLTIKPFHNSVINFISKSMLSVYMISEHSLVRPLIWMNLFKPVQKLGYSPLHFIVYAFATVLVVFVTCTIIDVVLGKPIVKIVSWFISQVRKLLKNISTDRIVE
ncbi:acyltransferase [Paucilactobacillus nenjiangensis]|uniref:acyltransferase n=1 Tax=Paucilactobacillus nenjiangensis TaxID=1296540 RepID=UPI0010F8192D|nr:acyltransferase [Paucilactobacillus nenjiangensis]